MGALGKHAALLYCPKAKGAKLHCMEFFHHREGPASLSRRLGGQAPARQEAHCALRLPHGDETPKKKLTGALHSGR